MTGTSRNPESGGSAIKGLRMPSSLEVRLAVGDQKRVAMLMIQAELARDRRSERLREAGARARHSSVIRGVI